MKAKAAFVTVCAVAGMYWILPAMGGDHNPPGRDPCSHGATGKECKPDPQPDNGKDCEHHGNNGGVNEDHCKTTSTTQTTPTSPTVTTGGTTTTSGTSTQSTVTVTQPPVTNTQTQTVTTSKDCPPAQTQTVTVQGPAPPAQTVTTTVEAPPKVIVKTVVKVKVKKVVVVKWKYRHVKRHKHNCRFWHGRCHPIVHGRG